MDALLAELTAIAGPEHVLTDPDLVAGYTTDWTRRFSGVARGVVRPAEVAEVVAFLAGPGGRAFTGSSLTMDQGWTAR